MLGEEGCRSAGVSGLGLWGHRGVWGHSGVWGHIPLGWVHEGCSNSSALPQCPWKSASLQISAFLLHLCSHTPFLFWVLQPPLSLKEIRGTLLEDPECWNVSDRENICPAPSQPLCSAHSQPWQRSPGAEHVLKCPSIPECPVPVPSFS